MLIVYYSELIHLYFRNHEFVVLLEYVLYTFIKQKFMIKKTATCAVYKFVYSLFSIYIKMLLD